MDLVTLALITSIGTEVVQMNVSLTETSFAKCERIALEVKGALQAEGMYVLPRCFGISVPEAQGFNTALNGVPLDACERIARAVVNALNAENVQAVPQCFSIVPFRSGGIDA